jgi:streptogramin lyase
LELLEDRTLLSLMLPQQSPDPVAPGPLDVTRAVYQEINGDVQTVASGYGSFTPEFKTSLDEKVEVLADVYYPTNLPKGPYPLVVFLHGQHPATTPDLLPIPSYIGYDYISQTLASDGYIVVSISANLLNNQDNQDQVSMLARAQLIQHHLDLWNQFNKGDGGSFGAQFKGKVDLNDIGLMGHSRGGEGVATEVTYNAGLAPEKQYGIKAVLPLAPVKKFFEAKLNNVALGVILPYADGDVQPLSGVGYFDDAYNAVAPSKTNTSPEEMFLVMGANHNFFNTVWTPGNPGHFPASDDWEAANDPFAGTVPSNKRLNAAQQRAVGAAYVTAFFRRYLGGETAFDPMLKGDALPPASTDVVPGQPADIHTTYFAPNSPTTRLDVNRLDMPSDVTKNSLGGLVTSNLTQEFVPTKSSVLPSKYDSSKQEPDATFLARVQIKWNQSLGTAYYANALPAGNRDLSRYAALEFRVGEDFADPLNSPTQGQDFSVVLKDGAGVEASVKVSDWSTALYYPPGQVVPIPKVFLNGVRIPLGAFLTANRKLDLSDIRSIRFDFDPGTKGDLVFSNISLNDASALARLFLLEGPAAGSDSDIVVSSGAWTATANVPWLHTSSQGSGNGLAPFTFDANTGPTRTGTLTIAGQTLTVTQAGSSYVAANPVTPLVPSGLKTPVGVAVDAAGNVYIADGDNAIKKWSASTQQVTPLVSGLNSPEYVAVDAAGNVYITDADNKAILEWNASTTKVTTLVSSGLSSAFRLAVDVAGNVYIADTIDNAIKEYNASTKQLSTLVSTGLSRTFGVAVDAAGNVYIADTNNKAIKEYNATTTKVTTLVSSGLDQPTGVAVDSQGDVYIADTGGNNTIKEWSASTQEVSTLLSSGVNFIGGVAVDAAGNVYLSETYQNALKERVRAYVPGGAVSEGQAAGFAALLPVLPSTQSLTLLFAPKSDQSWLTLGTPANGVIPFSFTANEGAARTAHITVLGQSIPVSQAVYMLGTNALLEGPAAGNDSDSVVGSGAWTATANVAWLHTSSQGSGNGLATFTFDANPGATRKGTLTIAGQTLTVTQAGSSYVAANPVHSYVPGGAVSEGQAAGSDALLSVLPSTQPLTGPFAPKSDQPWLTIKSTAYGVIQFSFTAFTANVGAARTAHITVLGQSIPVTQGVYLLGTNALVEYPQAGSDTDIVVGSGAWTATAPPESWLHTSSQGSGNGLATFTFDANPGPTRTGTLTIAGQTLTVTQPGSSYVAVNPVTTLVYPGLKRPFGVAVDAAGNVYFADGVNNQIEEWQASTQKVTILVSSGLSGPTGVAVDAAGNVYFADQGNKALKEWKASTQQVITLFSDELNLNADFRRA